jgi:hypothetical protein
MRHFASVTATAMVVALAGASSAKSAESVPLAPVDYAFINTRMTLCTAGKSRTARTPRS